VDGITIMQEYRKICRPLQDLLRVLTGTRRKI
jgi:hypothetical protein